MLRIRRYRIFLIIASITIVTLYQFTNIRNWDTSSSIGFESLKNFGAKEAAKPNPPDTKPPKPDDGKGPELVGTKGPEDKGTEGQEAKETKAHLPSADASLSSASSDSSPTLIPVEIPLPSTSTPQAPMPKITPGTPPSEDPGPTLDKLIHEEGKGRSEVPSFPDNLPAIHWSQLREHFPIPSESIVSLPTANPKTISNIQFKFKEEDPAAKAAREKKLGAIKETFKHSWAGYKDKAWTHDELKPMSGGFRDPFNGWGATLVDSIDTLWIMGLRKEYEEAVDAVKDIDFTTTKRNDIPLFETTIRYLGGLLGAYDISGGKERILLDKAVQLGEVLMGAFDTPNRMPQMFYLWKPTYASQPHRAGVRVTLAEIGSLSLEFTRLAQITKEPRYYDAIARITDAFEIWQNNTLLPGMWPLSVDASGCGKDVYTNPTDQQPIQYPDIGKQSPSKPLKENEPLDSKGSPGKDRIRGWDDKASSSREGRSAHDSPRRMPGAVIGRRQLDDLPPSKEEVKSPPENQAPENQAPENQAPENQANSAVTGVGIIGEMHCDPQGLASSPGATEEKFTLGGRADSIYEYLPKEYLLLGGLNNQYRDMYLNSIEVVKKKLLFRPMNPDDRDLLFAGSLTVTRGSSSESGPSKLDPEGTHLTCFAGGMLALGAKIFDRPDELELGSKLTDGCVWAYEATQTGLMPERFYPLPCKDKTKCKWNETAYWDALDPYAESRERQRKQRQQIIADSQKKEKESVQDKSGPLAKAPAAEVETPRARDSKEKRQTKEKELDLTPSTSKEEEASALKAAAEEMKGSDKGSGKDESTPVQKGTNSADDGKEPTNKESDKKPEIKDSTEKKPETKEADKKPEILEADKISGNKDGDGQKLKNNEPIQKAATTSSAPGSVYTPPAPPTHEEYVKSKISDDRLPPGFVSIGAKKYILRPEAIESVFILYRITGDEYWREKGWAMFTAMERHTRTEWGNSAISDVTAEHPELVDEMESFWLAETLKYFYLLFSDPSVVSLDEYVLNTEAHMFKRPQPKAVT
ncbi:MAG: hypothetical protein M1837_004915 [Sclerophora amabilis]|nr:MAG: hypothetical protein M1837_004915 [Sclerophora amabilis]